MRAGAREWIVTAVLMAVACVSEVSAQIRIVPQAKLDSVANPTLAGRGEMLFAEGRVAEFGTLVEEAEPWSTTLRWTNASDKPLVVTKVTTGCSCVSAEPSRGTVAKGEQGWIKLTFNPRGRVGGVVQKVWIYTNLSADKPTAVVELRGRVTTPDTERGYPKVMGALRLGAESITLAAGGKTSIACKNGGTRALQIVADPMLSSQGVTLRTEPKILAAGAEGVLIVECEKGVENPVRLYVGGLELPPRARKLDVVITE